MIASQAVISTAALSAILCGCVHEAFTVPAVDANSPALVGDSAFVTKLMEGQMTLGYTIISFPTEQSLIIKDGTHCFSIAFDEWDGQSLGTTCNVVIKGDSVHVLHDGTGALTGKKGDVLEAGILMKHTRTGNWIIGHTVDDVNAKEIGGCGEGPTIIDLKRRIFWTC